MLGLNKLTVILLAAFFILGGITELTAGTIKGTITAKNESTRRIAKRYVGGKTNTPATLEEIPAVAMILGPVNGAPPPKPPKDAVINQKDTRFQPNILVVPVGASVTFPNLDHEFHNVFSYSKTKRFDLGRYHKGESKSVRFEKPGIGKIFCEIHEHMRAAVVVVENPFYAVADENGNYSINNIPAGSYELLIWKIDHKKVIQRVTVPAAGTLELNFELPRKKGDQKPS